MGCDISTSVQVLESGVWKRVEDAPYADTRDYSLFALLAGVRAKPGDPPPLVEPRGFPEGPRKYEPGDGPDAATWYLLEELEPTRGVSEAWDQFLDACAALGPPERVRIVMEFWS